MDIVIFTINNIDINKFIHKAHKDKIKLLKIKYIDNNIEITILKKDLDKVLSYSNSIEIKKYIGVTGIKKVLSKNRYIILSIFLGLIILILLTNTIFNIEVYTDINDFSTILKDYGIKKYSKAKTFDELDNIKKTILNDMRDEIEWLSIKRVGTKYIVKAFKRYNFNKEIDNKIYKLVASKDGLIRHIDASSGEVIGYVGKYVHKGDILIDSEIKLNENIKNIVSAKGNVFGQTWYKIHLEYPMYERKIEYGEKVKKRLCLKFFTKYICSKNGYTYIDKDILKNMILPISLVYQIGKEKYDNYIKLEYDEALSKALEYGRIKLQEKLSKEEYIISEKSLKSEIKDSKILVDVFYTVYENIGTYIEIEGYNDLQR